MMMPETVQTFFEILEKENPNPQGELHFTNTYTLLVAVLLSAQATDKGVNKATEKLFQVVSTPEDMVALGEEGLKEYIKTIGLFNTKAKNTILMSQRLIDYFGSQVPPNREALESLPGVGRKTANVVLNAAFGLPTMAVDTHIFRVSNRTGLAPGKTPRQVEERLFQVVPASYKIRAHHWLILLGRYICKARRPECWHCPVREVCLYEPKNLVG